ncbi:MAG TPA: hypothetical protein VIL74_12310 [Pyrinomonadaceae bacterium]|jgi:hypothetical protein
MSRWNFRVLKKDDLFAIHSVYYDEDGEIVGWNRHPDPVIDEDLDYLKTQLTLMLEATEKEVIDLDAMAKESES